MENASKALIMAGAILIGILVLSIGLLLWNSSQSLSEKYDSKMASEEIDQFNSKFLIYDKDIGGQEMVSLINMAQENNIKYAGMSDRQITIYVNNVVVNLNNPESFKVKIMQEEDGTSPTYRIANNGVSFYDNGYIKEIRFTTMKVGYVNDASLCNPHDYTDWTPNDKTIHFKTCRNCGTVVTDRHTLTYTSKDGSKHIVKCEICGLTYEEAHEGQTHSNGGKCVKCNQVYVTHTWGAWQKTKDETCTVKGTDTRWCSCNITETRDRAPLGHNWAPATCTVASTCRRCGATSGSPLGHSGGTHANGGKCTTCGTIYQTHTWNGWQRTTEPTCTAKGQDTRTCTCGSKEYRDVNALGHNWGAWTKTKDETCTATGTDTRTCARCGKKETRDRAALGHNYGAATCTAAATCTRCNATSGSALGHDWGAWTKTKDETCTTTGTDTRTCKKCGATETRDRAASGHNWAAATCTAPATCTKCKATTGSAAGHDWGAWTKTKDETCTTKGTDTRTCKKCGATETRDRAALGHSYSDATCTTPKTCGRCGATTGSALGHTGGNRNNKGKCTRCGTYYTSTGYFIIRMYRSVLGREPESSGFNNHLATGRGYVIAMNVACSLEARNRHGSNVVEFIRTLYSGILGRTAADSEVNHWVNQYKARSGGVTVYRDPAWQEIVSLIAESNEFQTVCARLDMPW